MMRAPTEEPKGLVYQPELLSAEEEERLLDYDYDARTPQPGEPIPEWLLPVRARAAELAGHEPGELAEILVQRYPEGSTVRWHRDETVVGVSLGGSSRLRFQRGKREKRRVWELRYSTTFHTLRGEGAP
jgi:DNA oxidative demethylase